MLQAAMEQTRAARPTGISARNRPSNINRPEMGLLAKHTWYRLSDTQLPLVNLSHAAEHGVHRLQGEPQGRRKAGQKAPQQGALTAHIIEELQGGVRVVVMAHDRRLTSAVIIYKDNTKFTYTESLNFHNPLSPLIPKCKIPQTLNTLFP